MVKLINNNQYTDNYENNGTDDYSYNMDDNSDSDATNADDNNNNIDKTYDDNTTNCGAWQPIGRFDALRPKGCGFESRSSCHVKTFGKFFTRSCLWRLGVKLWHSILAVSGAPLSSSGLEEVL